MKNICKMICVTASIVAMLLISSTIVAEAQVIYNTGGEAMLQTMITNTMNQITVNDLTTPGMVMAMKAERARIEKIGAAKIAAGKATLNFASTQVGTEATAKSITWDAEQPTLESQVAYIKKTIFQFEQLMQQNGFKPRDAADGYAFAYALAYAAYYNRDMPKSELEAIRSKEREGGLKNAYYQGLDDLAKQRNYETDALMAMQAVKYRAKYRQQATTAEKSALAEKAQYFANALLKINKK